MSRARAARRSGVRVPTWVLLLIDVILGVAVWHLGGPSAVVLAAVVVFVLLTLSGRRRSRRRRS